MLTVLETTGYTEEQIKAFNLPVRLATQAKLTAGNEHTSVLVINAVVQGNEKVKEGLLVIANFQMEFGELSHEMFEFRNWLSSLLVK